MMMTRIARLMSQWLGLVLLPAALAHAAFDIYALAPRERGAATGLVSRPAEKPYVRGAVTIYGFRPFGMADIDFIGIRAAVPIQRIRSRYSIAYHRLSALSYVEDTFEFAWGFDLKGIWFEPAVTLGRVSVGGDVMDWALFPDLSLRAALSNEANLAVKVKNPLGLKLTRNGSTCPQRIMGGLTYLVSADLMCGIEVLKEPQFPTSIRTGAEWHLFDRLSLRSGLSTHPEEFCFGIGVRVRSLLIDLAMSHNLDLGTTNEVGATYRWE
jgi:hypothetical protein